MNLKKFKADKELHRKEAECFVGCEVNYDENKTSIGQLVGLDYDREYFVVEGLYEAFGLYETDENYRDCEEITIDLDTAQPCVYMAMKNGLMVQVEWERENKRVFDFKDNLIKGLFFDYDKHFNEIKSIKLLGGSK